MLDSKGVIHKGRHDLDEYKSFFASDKTDKNTSCWRWKTDYTMPPHDEEKRKQYI